MALRMPDKKAAMEFRKFTPYYFKGMTGVKDLKIKMSGLAIKNNYFEYLYNKLNITE